MVGIEEAPELPRFAFPEHGTQGDRGDEAQPIEEARHQSGREARHREIRAGEDDRVLEHVGHDERGDEGDGVFLIHALGLGAFHVLVAEVLPLHPHFAEERSIPEEAQDHARDGGDEDGQVINGYC